MDVDVATKAEAECPYDNEDALDLDEMLLMYGIQGSSEEDDLSIESEDSETLREKISSQLFVVRASSTGKIISQFKIEESSESIAALLVQRNTATRVSSCMKFRSMLHPIAKSNVPTRDEEWLRRCMRGILVSAMMGDNLDLDSRSRPLGTEHTYCWFVENLGMKVNDEDIWSFYCGVKQMAKKDDAEACLHYLILDEANLDSAEFLFDTLLYIRNLMGQSWHAQFDLETECQQQQIWISTELTEQVIRNMFTWTDPPLDTVDLTQRVMDLPSETTTDTTSSRVDLFTFLQLLLKAHMDQIKLQTTLLHVMFETASKHEDVAIDEKKLVSLTALHQILKTIHESISLRETTLFYQDAYELMTAAHSPNGSIAPRGITFDSFLFAAKRRGLFAQIRSSQGKLTGEENREKTST